MNITTAATALALSLLAGTAGAQRSAKLLGALIDFVDGRACLHQQQRFRGNFATFVQIPFRQLERPVEPQGLDQPAVLDDIDRRR